MLQLQPLAVVNRPFLVLVAGEQRPAVHRQCRLDRIGVADAQSAIDERLEALDVNVYVSIRRERRQISAKHDDVRGGGAPREVGGLMEPRRRCLW